MGYTTKFTGQFAILNEEGEYEKMAGQWFDYINRFAATRHCKRDVYKLEVKSGRPYSLGWSDPLGRDGEFYAAPSSSWDERSGVTEYNQEAGSCPGLWCNWIVTRLPHGDFLKWNGAEKFYYYVEWLKFIQDNFLAPQGLHLDGTVEYEGEDETDFGIIEADKTGIRLYEGRRVNEVRNYSPSTAVMVTPELGVARLTLNKTIEKQYNPIEKQFPLEDSNKYEVIRKLEKEIQTLKTVIRHQIEIIDVYKRSLEEIIQEVNNAG